MKEKDLDWKAKKYRHALMTRLLISILATFCFAFGVFLIFYGGSQSDISFRAQLWVCALISLSFGIFIGVIIAILYGR